MDTIYSEIDEMWVALCQRAADAGVSHKAERSSVLPLIVEAEAKAAAHSDLLQPWLAASELAVEALYHLHRYALSVRAASELPPSFAMLAGRACSHGIGIRSLVLKGQDEVANVVLRSFFENLDIALVALDDPKFAERYVTSDSQEAKEFWSGEIGRNKVQLKAEEVLKKSGVPVPNLQTRRKNDWLFLSGSTHSSFMSAFRASAVISIIDGSLVPSPVGHLGVNGPIILDRVAKETLEFTGAVMRLSIQTNPPTVFERSTATDQPALGNLGAAFFTLQEFLRRHGKDIETLISKWNTPVARPSSRGV